MSDKRKPFRVRCPHYARSFTVRYGQPDAASESADKPVVVVDCLHCGKASAITVPRECVPQDEMIRGVVTDQRPAPRRPDGDPE